MGCRALIKWKEIKKKKHNTVNPAVRYRTQEIYLEMHDLSNSKRALLFFQRIAHSLPPALIKGKQSWVSDEKRESKWKTKTTLSMMTMQCRWKKRGIINTQSRCRLAVCESP